MAAAKLRIRPRRIRVSRAYDGRDVFIIRVADFPDGDKTGDARLAMQEAWFHTWVSLPDLLTEKGPFDLSVEECIVPVPPEIGFENEAFNALMRPTLIKNDLTLGALGGAVLRAIRDCKEA